MRQLRYAVTTVVCSLCSLMSLGAEDVLRMDEYIEVAGRKADCFFTIEGAAPIANSLNENMAMVTNLYGMENRLAVLSNLTACVPEYVVVTNSVCANVFHLISTNLVRSQGKGFDATITMSYEGLPSRLNRHLMQVCPGIRIDTGIVVGEDVGYTGGWDWQMKIAVTNMCVREVLTNFLPIDETWYRTLWTARFLGKGRGGVDVYGVRFGGKGPAKGQRPGTGPSCSNALRRSMLRNAAIGF